MPATGKTTLARRLAADLQVPMFHKDGFKEALMDRVGWQDAELTSLLGAASFELLFHVLEANLQADADCILEANFRSESLPRLLQLRDRYAARLLEVYCWAEPRVLARRIEERIQRGERHPGHHDVDWLTAMNSAEELADAALRHRLNLPDGCLRVQAVGLPQEEYAALLADLRIRLES
jgi:predicted kinase